MRQRGRTSAAELSVARAFYKVKTPDYLTGEQKQTWRDCVRRMGDDYFPPETLPLLERYCCVLSYVRLVEREIQNDDLTFSQKMGLIERQQKLTATLMSLSTKLRFAQSSVQSNDKQRPKFTAPAWAQEQDDDAA